MKSLEYCKRLALKDEIEAHLVGISAVCLVQVHGYTHTCRGFPDSYVSRPQVGGVWSDASALALVLCEPSPYSSIELLWVGRDL